jgi:hypothetical protein
VAAKDMKQQITKVLKGLKKEQWEDLNDAYSNMKTKYYTDMGFPDEFVKKFMTEFESDGTYTGSLWKDPMKAIAILSEIRRIPKGQELPQELVARFNEQYIPKTIGIYSLDFLKGLAKELEIEYDTCLGRGRQARYIISAIQSSLHLPLTTS